MNPVTNPKTTTTTETEAIVLIDRDGETVAVFCSDACVERHYVQNAWHGETEARMAASTIPYDVRCCAADPCMGEGF